MALRPKKKPAWTETFRFTLDPNWPFWLPRGLLIAGLTLWIFWPALHGGWVWDDTWYIRDNLLLADWNGLWKFWYRPGSWVEYYPIAETVLWTQWHLWGADTLGYHLTNIFLHIASALLLWRLLAKFGLRFAWMGGLLFAVHPVQVEAIAWISELKSALALPFFLLAMCSWIDYEENRRKLDYQKALGWFLVGMLCKISIAPFPVIILLYAWWKRGRVAWTDLNAAAPFFVISVLLGITTVVVGNLYVQQSHEQPDVIVLGGLFSRLAGAGLILAADLGRIFLSLDLLLSYPQWKVGSHLALVFLFYVLAGGLFYLFWKRRRAWGRHAILGIGFFLAFLAPFLGLNAVSYMTFTWTMDHLLYVPVIGIIGLVVAALGDLETKLSRGARHGLWAAFTAAIALMTWESHVLAGIFANDRSFWTYIVERDPGSWEAHYNIGVDLLDAKNFPAAIDQLNAAIQLNPRYSDAYCDLGLSLSGLGRTREAKEQYHQALAVNPDNVTAHLDLGQILLHEGDLPGAEKLLAHAVQLDPGNVAACVDLGNILVQSGRPSEALSLFQKAAELNPDIAQIRYMYGSALLGAQDFSHAVEQLRAAVDLDPKFAPAHENLGAALARSGDVPDAIAEFQTALELDPSSSSTRDNLALALAQTGHLQEAIEQLQQALQANPNDVNSRQLLAKVRKALAGQLLQK